MGLRHIEPSLRKWNNPKYHLFSSSSSVYVFLCSVSLGLVIPYQDVQCLCTQDRTSFSNQVCREQNELQHCERDGAATQVSEHGRGRKVGQQWACTEKQEAGLRKGRLLESWCVKKWNKGEHVFPAGRFMEGASETPEILGSWLTFMTNHNSLYWMKMAELTFVLSPRKHLKYCHPVSLN